MADSKAILTGFRSYWMTQRMILELAEDLGCLSKKTTNRNIPLRCSGLAAKARQWVRLTVRSQRTTILEEQRRGFIWKKKCVKSLEQQMKLWEWAPPSLLLEFSTPTVASSLPPQPSSTALLSCCMPLTTNLYLSTFHKYSPCNYK